MFADIESKQKCKRSIFSQEEDNRLKMLVAKCGKNINWRTIAFDMEGRTPRQCRERYMNYLNPNVKIGNWTPQEDQILLMNYNVIGNHWQKIADKFKCRTASAVRNRF